MNKKVILISIDGLRPDAVETCGHPFVNTLRENGCYSPDASSVMPPVTLPAHTSIFYSVPPIRHGIITNDYMPPVRPIRGLAEQLERADKTCAAFYGWEPMRHVWTSGNMKYSLFVNEYEEDNSDLLLTQEALSLIERKEPDFVYLYLVETDDKGGHDHGWMTSEYMHRVNNAFSCVQQVYEAVHDRYTIVITADHGGHDRGHGENIPEDMTIPMFFVGKEFPNGVQLHGLTLLDLAPTIADLMKISKSREWEGTSVLEKLA